MVGILLNSCSRENSNDLHLSLGLSCDSKRGAYETHAAFPATPSVQQTRDGTCHRDDLENSLNAGVSCRKDRGRSNLGEQVHQVRDPPSIELLHRLDEPASEISSAKGSLSQWNFSTVRSHDMGLARPPS
jgi:hypothetical protein